MTAPDDRNPPDTSAAPPAAPLLTRLADADFERHWRSGSLKYRDFRPLTEGGGAVLQTCRDINLNRRVVYKALHAHQAQDQTAVARFVREARVTANISHPGTASVYEIGRDRGGAVYFTMKFIRGRDLRDVIAALAVGDAGTAAAFPIERRLNLLTEVARTLRYAHRSGVVHRDLKPANLLAGVFGEAILLDFGLAQLLDPAATPEAPPDHAAADDLSDTEPLPPGEDPDDGHAAVCLHLTQQGNRLGTPLYMSPEQAAGRPTDPRTDVYGWGTVLFEALTLRPLVFGEDPDDVARQIRDAPAPPPSEARGPRASDEITPELDAVCLRCLQKDPEDRFQNFGQLLAALGPARGRRRGDR